MVKTDGFGNRLDKIKMNNDGSINIDTINGKFEKGDRIAIFNKEGCRIATYEVI